MFSPPYSTPGRNTIAVLADNLPPLIIITISACRSHPIIPNQIQSHPDHTPTNHQHPRRNDRKKLITLCTIDVHARDVVARLIEERVESGACFQWQSQLRYYQDDKTKDCKVGAGGQAAG